MPFSAEVRTGTTQKTAGRGHTFVIQNKAISHHSAVRSLHLISHFLAFQLQLCQCWSV